MSNLPVDRNKQYMYSMWGTTKLVTDYGSLPDEKSVIREILHDEVPNHKHLLREQAEMHEKIRNDEDYDDWEYGTEPVYGKPQ